MNKIIPTPSYTYNKANQLVTSTVNEVTTHYKYDAAGRLVKEGNKTYAYGWLDKVLSVTENGQQIASFNYHNDGQIAQAIHDGKSEDFLWDGLALIHRGETSFINEPYVTGGNPILSSKDGVMFNDMLGSTLNIGGKAVNMTYCIPEIFKSYTQSYGDATYLNIGQMVSMMYALGGFLFVGMIPLVAYIYYLVSYVSLDIIRAVLSLPQKLDELKK